MYSFHRLDNQELKPDRACRLAVWLVLSLIAAGCESGRSTTDYVPASNQARQAVERTLETWKSGSVAESTLQLANNGPHLQIFDKQRAGGKKLTKFEVVRELPAKTNRPRQFSVKLSFEGDTADTETSYYVVGIDPLLVFRDAEYNQASGMNK